MKNAGIIIGVCLAVFYACLAMASNERQSEKVTYTLIVNGVSYTAQYDKADELPPCIECGINYQSDYRE